ncbi:AN1-type zinc finger protein 6 [Papilio xuthus]|uniref:AN1-type zinc finger protein 6 n=1 Tax=Papilio xuthus TaxID=66420 RepID=A0A194Q1E3_PAPXU|nr:AN1-type zinc finger protein 6 [Papilio xuthus]
MERESNPMEALCRSGCGFYGNPSTDGLCSVCFKEALKKKQQPPASTPSPVATSFVPTPTPAPVPAPTPTPLAAAAPTVPSLPVQPQTHTDVRPLYLYLLQTNKFPHIHRKGTNNFQGDNSGP